MRHRTAGEEEVYTTEEFLALLEAEGKRPLARLRRGWLRAWEFLPNRWRDLECFWQRGRRGWSYRDAWNVDHHLAQITSEMLRHLATHDPGWPGENCGLPEGETEEAWIAHLHSLANAFADYAAGGHDMSREHRQETLARMRQLFDCYGYLWK